MTRREATTNDQHGKPKILSDWDVSKWTGPPRKRSDAHPAHCSRCGDKLGDTVYLQLRGLYKHDRSTIPEVWCDKTDEDHQPGFDYWLEMTREDWPQRVMHVLTTKGLDREERAATLACLAEWLYGSPYVHWNGRILMTFSSEPVEIVSG